jgi:branched-chain amino acid transport system ATP-binding protein
MVDGTDRVMCLAEGNNVITGLPYEVMQSKVVSDVYLGVDEDD